MTLAAGAIDKYSMLLLLMSIGFVATLLLRGSPRAAVAGWLVVLAFVPVWLGVDAGVYLAPAVLVGGLVLVALGPFPSQAMRPVDWAVGMLALACLAPILVGAATPTSVFVVGQWMIAFLLGRLTPGLVSLRWVYGCVAVIFTLVSAAALIEFAMSWNPFVEIPGGGELYRAWSPIQVRAGLLRAEGAFGHSIALGSSVSMAVPVTLASRFPIRVRVAMVSLMLVATVVTFSRVAIVAAMLSVVLSMWALRTDVSRTARGWITAACLGLAAAAVPSVSSVFSQAGTEAASSASYRGRLTSLIPEISVLGLSPSAYRDPSGELHFGRFQSIDSALLLLGLTYGWLALIIMVGLLVSVVLLVVARRAEAPTVALAAQIPAFLTVALITQYSLLVWFVAGLAVSAQIRRSETPSEREASTLSPPVPNDTHTHASSRYRNGGVDATA